MKTPADYPVFIRYSTAVEIGQQFGYGAWNLKAELLPKLTKYYPPGKPANACRALYKTSEVFDLLQPVAVSRGK